MTLEETLTKEAIKVIMIGISWKYSEGCMDGQDWENVQSFMDYVKETYPDIADESPYLFD